MSWRTVTDFAKKNESLLRLADRLGRGKGRFRVLDTLSLPPRIAVPPDFSKWETYELAACWIGHATVLLRVGGQTIMTDPVFSSRVGVGLGLATGGPKRLLAPAASF